MHPRYIVGAILARDGCDTVNGLERVVDHCWVLSE